MRTAFLLLVAVSVAYAQSVKLQVHTPAGDSVVELPLERYVAAVLAGEGAVLRSDAARKALAVAARTYAVKLRGRHAPQGFDFCDSTHCQHADRNAITPAIETIVSQTAGEVLWFDGAAAFTPYSRDCGGRTEDASAVWPDLAATYLRSQPDPYCVRAQSTTWQWTVDPTRVAAALVRNGLKTPKILERVEIVQHTPSGRARTLLLTGGGEDVRISAGSFHTAIGRELGWNTLLSDRYQVDRLVFRGTGSGHGVGLCQRGADQMGADGRSYRDILAFYYPGTTPGTTTATSARGIPWQRLSGDSVTLFTTQPEQDRSVLGMVQQLTAQLTQRTGWPVPANIEIRVYPTLDAFRNTTGEPGWVAAHADGRRIHLQPIASLRARNALQPVLRHELLHVLMEAQATPNLPVWFREGLVGYLEGGSRASAPTAPPADSSLRQTADANEARRAYADAVAAVTRLVVRYGEGGVLEMVKSGVPK